CKRLIVRFTLMNVYSFIYYIEGGILMGQMIFSDPLVLNAIRYSNKEAISYNGKRFTYREFNERVNQLSHALQGLGVKKGDKVAYMLPNCNELVEIMFACSKIGAVFIPINARFVGREIAHVLNNSRSIVLFFDSRFGDIVNSELEKYETAKQFISIGNDHAIANYEYETLLSEQHTTEPTPDEPLSENDT